MKTGLTQIYTGDGKGKTTCAIGLCVRAAGYGLKVRIFQFCKTEPSGELNALGKLPSVQLERAEVVTRKFTWDMTPEEKAAWSETQQALFDAACEAATDKQTDLVVLDEILGAIAAGAIDVAQVAYLMEHKFRGCELVLTGRDAPGRLVDKADYVTEMRMVKHPYTEGQHARRGIEY